MWILFAEQLFHVLQRRDAHRSMTEWRSVNFAREFTADSPANCALRIVMGGIAHIDFYCIVEDVNAEAFATCETGELMAEFHDWSAARSLYVRGKSS